MLSGCSNCRSVCPGSVATISQVLIQSRAHLIVGSVAKRTEEVIENEFVLSDFISANDQDLSILLSEVDNFLVFAPMSIFLANGCLFMTGFAIPHSAKEKGKNKINQKMAT